jgi:hypothetical protein
MFVTILPLKKHDILIGSYQGGLKLQGRTLATLPHSLVGHSKKKRLLLLLLLLLLEYVYPTEQVQLRDRRIAREKKYIQITLPKDVKRMLMYVIIFAHGI